MKTLINLFKKLFSVISCVLKSRYEVSIFSENGTTLEYFKTRNDAMDFFMKSLVFSYANYNQNEIYSFSIFDTWNKKSIYTSFTKINGGIALDIPESGPTIDNEYRPGPTSCD